MKSSAFPQNNCFHQIAKTKVKMPSIDKGGKLVISNQPRVVYATKTSAEHIESNKTRRTGSFLVIPCTSAKLRSSTKRSCSQQNIDSQIRQPYSVCMHSPVPVGQAVLAARSGLCPIAFVTIAQLG